MNKKNVFIAIIVLIVAAAVLVLMDGRDITRESFKNNLSPNAISEDEKTALSDENEINQVPVQNYRAARYEELKNTPLSVPDREEPPGAGFSGKFKEFNVSVEGNSVSLPLIVVKEGDMLQIVFSSKENIDVESKDLKFYFELKVENPAVVSIPLEETGVFSYSCSQKCPIEGSFMGEILAIP